MANELADVINPSWPPMCHIFKPWSLRSLLTDFQNYFTNVKSSYVITSFMLFLIETTTPLMSNFLSKPRKLCTEYIQTLSTEIGYTFQFTSNVTISLLIQSWKIIYSQFLMLIFVDSTFLAVIPCNLCVNCCFCSIKKYDTYLFPELFYNFPILSHVKVNIQHILLQLRTKTKHMFLYRHLTFQIK